MYRAENRILPKHTALLMLMLSKFA